MIEVKSISKSFGGEKVLDDISIFFEKGKTNLIIGQSGSGKTVLMKCCIGLLEVDEGEIMFDGRLFSGLKEKKFYQAVESGKATMARRDGTLLVKAKVTGMRIVSGHARMWGGAFTGSSFMEVDLVLIDAATNTVVREKKLSSANNPWAAAWVGGASDQSLPADTGRMLAEYVHSVMPK